MAGRVEITLNKELEGLVSRRQFYNEHQTCPECSGETDIKLLYAVEYDSIDFHDGISRAKCKCGWKGFVYELLPKI